MFSKLKGRKLGYTSRGMPQNGFAHYSVVTEECNITGAGCRAVVKMLNQLQQYINTVGMATRANIVADKRLWR
jgi:hypothetical protein